MPETGAVSDLFGIEFLPVFIPAGRDNTVEKFHDGSSSTAVPAIDSCHSPRKVVP
jgi:hypothetical protein